MLKLMFYGCIYSKLFYQHESNLAVGTFNNINITTFSYKRIYKYLDDSLEEETI